MKTAGVCARIGAVALAAGLVCITLSAATAAQAQGRGRDRDNYGRRGYDSYRRYDGGRRYDGYRRYDSDRYYGRGYSSEPSFDLFLSPDYFYLGIGSIFTRRSHRYNSPPSRVYIEIPIRVNNNRRADDDYYLNRRADDNRWKDDRALSRAVYDLEDAFSKDDMDLLSGLTDPGARIAVFDKGRYQYSLAPGDYLDATRDFLESARTTNFSVYRVHQKASGVYQVFARHTYRDDNDRSRTVYLCAVLERINTHWVLTQVDSAPDALDR